MIDISFETHPNLYLDYREGLEFLRNLDRSKFTPPKERTIFHIYSEFRTDKELVCLMSYFATQDLKNTSVIVWSDYDISDNPRIQRFRDLVDFRVWNCREEAKGSVLEEMPHILDAADAKHYLQSDLLRILALWKYGGIWIDMDIILLNDFTPILDQEFMYMWGAETNFAKDGACATVLSLKQKSEFANELMNELINTRIVPGSTCWGKTMFAKLYRRYKFDIFPAAFFNTEWAVNAVCPGLGSFMDDGWFKNKPYNDSFLFLEAFAWHWHNSSWKNAEVEAGSKFNLLELEMERRLIERGL
jgi:hypothetical protein